LICSSLKLCRFGRSLGSKSGGKSAHGVVIVLSLKKKEKKKGGKGRTQITQHEEAYICTGLYVPPCYSKEKG